MADDVFDLRAHDVNSPDGTRVDLWERAPTDEGEAVLFVHGATYRLDDVEYIVAAYRDRPGG